MPIGGLFNKKKNKGKLSRDESFETFFDRTSRQTGSETSRTDSDQLGIDSGRSTVDTGPNKLISPYLQQLYAQAANATGRPLDFFSGDLVANLTPAQQRAFQGIETLASEGVGVEEAAKSELADIFGGGAQNAAIATSNQALADTIAGAYLNANPHLDATFDAAARRVSDNFTKSALPALNAAFSAAGRGGSDTHQLAAAEASQGLTDSLGDLAANIYGENYARERGFQEDASRALGSQGFGQIGALLQAAGLAPELAAGERGDLRTLLDAGAIQQAQQQAEIDANRERFEFNRDAPFLQAQRLNSLLTPTANIGQFGSSTADNVSRNIGTSNTVGNRDFTTHETGTESGKSRLRQKSKGKNSGFGFKGAFN